MYCQLFVVGVLLRLVLSLLLLYYHYHYRRGTCRAARAPGAPWGNRQTKEDKKEHQSIKKKKKQKEHTAPWGNTNRVVSNRVASKGPLYPSNTKTATLLMLAR